MAPSTVDPESDDNFLGDYIKGRRRWLLIGLGGVAAGIIASGVGILWQEHALWFRIWCGIMLSCNFVLLALFILLKAALKPLSPAMHRAQVLRYSLLGFLVAIILVAPATLAYFTYSKGIILDVEGAYGWVPWMCAGGQLIPVGLGVIISFKLHNFKKALMGRGAAEGGQLLQPLAPSRRGSTRRASTVRPARPHSSSFNGASSSTNHRHGQAEFFPSDDSAIEHDHLGPSSHAPTARQNAAEYSSGTDSETQHNPLHPVRRTASARHINPNSNLHAPVVHAPSGSIGRDFAYDPPPPPRTRSLSMGKKQSSYSSDEESD